MSGAGTGYDLSSTTYNPEGKVFQIEYAAKAIENAPTVVGLRCLDGIVVGVEKPVHSRLIVPGSNRYTYAITKHSGILVTGVLPDGRAVMTRARQEAAGYQEQYGREIGISVLASRIASYMHLFTLYGGYRPFGVTGIVAGLEDGQPRLYMAESSGDFYEYYACSAGKSNQLCKTELDKLDLQSLTAKEAVYFIVKMLLKSHEEIKDKRFELELFWMTADSNFEFKPVPGDFLAHNEERARADIEQEEMGE